ncbi:MAG: nucleotidyltransferase domain-containing protein [Lachnospiraceae bacterium]|nr:nucleotidyltransferase domain-containing protein [Lachnospiraceae bacterium]
MISLEQRNQKIIDAVIKRADIVCPGALALIGIYGSFMTGDYYEKSDLDLLIIINDDRGWQLGCAFIQDDLQVGHDIYCITWERLQAEAGYEHPNISKLMDTEIVYCADQKYKEQLDTLRQTAKDILTSPFSEEDYTKAEKILKEAEHCYTSVMISEHKSDVLDGAGGVIYYVENAIAMLNKQYFHYGVKRAYEELSAMQNRPEKLCDMINDVISATSVASVKKHLSTLMKETIAVFHNVKEAIAMQKKTATGDMLIGTYEEMYSNWRNKMYAAAETGDRHLAFMSLLSSSAMFSEISSEVDISQYDVLGGYNSQDLHKTAKAYDDILSEYLEEYRKAGIQVKHYSDIEAFVSDYQINQ